MANRDIYSEKYKLSSHQLEVAVETDVVVFEEDNPDIALEEEFFSFMGSVIRWVNQKEDRYAVLILPVSDTDNYSDEITLLRRFTSWVVKECGVPVKWDSYILCAKGDHVVLNRPRTLAQIWEPSRFLYRDESGNSEEKWQAVSLFSEGVNSGFVYYKYLNFYKAAVVPFINGDHIDFKRFNSWIEKNIQVDDSELKSWASAYKSLGEYFSALRNSIGHVELLYDGTASVRPDNPADLYKVSKTTPFIQEAAKKAIDLL